MKTKMPIGSYGMQTGRKSKEKSLSNILTQSIIFSKISHSNNMRTRIFLPQYLEKRATVCYNYNAYCCSFLIVAG